MKMVIPDADMPSGQLDVPVPTSSESFSNANQDRNFRQDPIPTASQQTPKPINARILKRVKQAFDFADGTENVAILVFGTVVEEECPHVQNEKLTDWTARLLEVILEETGQDGHDLTSALKAYSSEEGRQRVKELLKEHCPDYQVPTERPDTHETLKASSESIPLHISLSDTVDKTGPLQVASMASDALGSDQAENDQVDDEMLGVTNNEDQFSGISIGSAWKKQSDKIKNAGHQDASEGETEENSKGPDVGEEAAATTEAGVDSDATQSSQPLIPAKKPLLITGRAWFRKLRQRCAKSFLKYKRQGRRSG